MGMWIYALLVASAVIYSPVVAEDTATFLKDADAAFGRGEYNMAVRIYSDAIGLDPKASMLYTKRAAAYMSLRQASQALRDLNKAIENDEAFVAGYIHRGKLHRQMCNTVTAQRDFMKVLELRPGSKTAVDELAKSQKLEALLLAVEAKFESESKQGIQEDLQAIYDLAQDCVKAQLMDAKLLLLRKDWDQVVATTGRLLKTDGSNMEALVLRGKGYFYSGDHDLAKRHFGEALKYDPDYKDAKTAFTKVKDYDRKRSRAMKALAEQNWAAAEDLFGEALNVDVDHGVGNKGLWQGIGEARFSLGKWDSAMEGFNSALFYENDNESAKAWLVRTLLGAERFQEAVNKAKEVVGQHQQSGELRQLLQEAERRLKMSLRKDYYKLLGIDKSAGDREIKKAYREMAKVYHPDKVQGTEEEKKVSENRFRDIAEAYEVLSDDEKRGRFDRGEDVDQPQHQQHQQGHPFGFHQQHGQQFHYNFGG